MSIRLLALALALSTSPAVAQQRVLVVPEGNGVAIPARGAVPGVSTMAPRQGRPRSSGTPVTAPEPEGPNWKQLWPLIPLGVAAAVVAATLPGGGGGGAGAPAATR